MIGTASRSTRAIVALDAIERLGSADMSAQQVAEEIGRRIAGVVGVDTYVLGAADPSTRLCLGPAIAHNFSEDLYQPYAEHELLVPDYNQFGDLTADNPVADLRLATGGKLSRSARHRVMHAIADLDDELRAMLPAGGRPWGYLHLNRHSGERPFTDADREFVRKAAPLAGAALRRAQLARPPSTDPNRGPGVMVLDGAGTVVCTTAEAEAWFRELTGGYRDDATLIGLHRELLMTSLSALVLPDCPPRRCRFRTPSGVWLVAHVSRLVGSDHRAVVIEPAKASEIAPIVVDAYGLTPREVEITRLVARGLTTAEIASILLLSPHTVRDHLKAVFEKVGVSSRGQLTSKLFAEHYHPSADDTIYTSPDRLQPT